MYKKTAQDFVDSIKSATVTLFGYFRLLFCDDGLLSGRNPVDIFCQPLQIE